MKAGEAGVALVNVLVVLAITSGLVVLLLSQQERGQSTVAKAAALAQAEQIALGAEASVLSALRADLDTAPDTDHFGESWAVVIQDEVSLPEGRFSVEVHDLQAKFDINVLTAGAVGPQTFFLRLAAALDLPEADARRIIQTLALTGPIRKLEDLEKVGIAAETVALLASHVGALPAPGTVNLNTADPFLMEVLFQNPGITAQLLRKRRSDGFLARGTLIEFGALRPEMTGFGSHNWQVDILAESGGATFRMRSVILRKNDLTGKAISLISREIIHTPAPD